MIRFSKWTSVAALATVAMFFTACEDDDLNSPVVTLEGGSTVSVRIGTPWVEPGATADDIEDGAISLITVDDTGFDTDVMGTYTLTYSATDDAGNVGTATRTVNVYVNSADLTGPYDVDEACDGGITDAYTASVLNSTDTANVIIENFFNNPGGSITINSGITLSGATNSSITIDAASGGATFLGNGTILSATKVSGGVEVTFEITYTTDDGTDSLTCTATYTKQ